MVTYYFKQIDRESGEIIGFITYNGTRPTNDDARILLEEITAEQFATILAQMEAEAPEGEEEAEAE